MDETKASRVADAFARAFPEWSVDPVEPTHAPHVRYLTHAPTGRRMYLTSQEGTVSAGGDWPNDPESETRRLWPGDFLREWRNLVVKVNPDRKARGELTGADLAALDLGRRWLPWFAETHDRVDTYVERMKTARACRLELCERLADALGTSGNISGNRTRDPLDGDGQRVDVLIGDGGPWGDLKPSYDGQRVEVSLHDVPPDLALALARFIKEAKP